ncbi:hypothetical protein PQX77_002960 [Marasmius sp. AFHP31]|nr:hypothetical protein PQX77_002960 [Marasmius sp. AFHP31]
MPAASPSLSEAKQCFRNTLEGRIAELVEAAAERLPADFKDANGCQWVHAVNLGKGRDFYDIGCVQVRCMNPTHVDHHYQYQFISERQPPSVLRQFASLRAIFELSGAKYSNNTTVHATNKEKVEVLDQLLVVMEEALVNAIAAVSEEEARSPPTAIVPEPVTRVASTPARAAGGGLAARIRRPEVSPGSAYQPGSNAFSYHPPQPHTSTLRAGSSNLLPRAGSSASVKRRKLGADSSMKYRRALLRGELDDTMPSSSPPPSSPCPSTSQKRTIGAESHEAGPSLKKRKSQKEIESFLGEIDITDGEEIVVKEEKIVKEEKVDVKEERSGIAKGKEAVRYREIIVIDDD